MNIQPDDCSINNELNTKVNYVPHKDSDWKYICELGKGGFGSVYKAAKIDGLINDHKVEMCAIKKVLIEKFCEQEVQILDRLKDNQYSMEYYGCGEDDEYKYIYIGCIDNVISVKDKIEESTNKRLEEAEILQLLKEVVVALKSIHNDKIIHRDIKEEHILCIHDDKDNKNRIGIKIIDFGVSKQCKDGTSYHSFAGTESYMAPEVKLQSGKASRKSDVYSLGCTLIKMADNSKLKTDTNGAPLIPGHLSNYLKNIIQRCTAPKEARFDIYGLYEHLFGGLDSKLENLSIDCSKAVTKTTIESSDLSVGDVPKGVTNLSLPLFDSKLTKDTIPESVIHLSFKVFSQDIESDDIPSTVKYLDLGDEFDIQSNGSNLPDDSITTLKCGFQFKKIINQKQFPSSVTDLQLHNYNLKLNSNSIPKSVAYLTLGSNFNDIESLTNLLTSSVINLTFNTTQNEETINNILSHEKIKSITSIIINGKERRS